MLGGGWCDVCAVDNVFTMIDNMIWKTALTKIGSDGRETIRGYDLQELIAKKSFVEVIFLLLKGVLPTDSETTMLNALFTAAIDHGVGAPSATVARTVASTGNSLHTALSAGVLALGELHGGAIEGASKFFIESKNVADLKDYLQELKNKKIRVSGFGHKVLTRDLRCDSLLSLAKQTGFYKDYCSLAIEVEKTLGEISSKKLPLNIDGAMAAIILDMGFDAELAKGFFLIARVPGLVAHIYEETKNREGLRRIDETAIAYEGEEQRSL